MGNYKLAGPVLLHTALPRHAMDDHGEGGGGGGGGGYFNRIMNINFTNLYKHGYCRTK